MPSVTIPLENLEKDGPILEVHFFISSELEKKYKEENNPLPEPLIIKALVDTGASACVLKDEIPKKLSLEPTGVIKICTPSSKDHECYQYFMRMIIPSNKVVYEGAFISAPLDGQDVSGLIGRDVLKNGILIYIGYANQFTLSLL